ncbi:MAG: hypothetical protein CBD62_01105 [Candidatus Pelagibacter sp. TMED202]|nr:MAG: hypothetical protein CBD62_01105 [Candidatus Pelagibacter sp. TMED202]|tara:strand:+ start:10371 stop:10697 length:327 start_codon:yes stop_codon:yes gene_type:complete
MTYSQDDQPVGVYEIALLLGVEPATVSSWRQRKRLPNPAGHLNKGRTPFWKTGDVLAWANATGRNKNINVQQTNEQIYRDNISDALVDTVVDDLEWDASVSNLDSPEL